MHVSKYSKVVCASTAALLVVACGAPAEPPMNQSDDSSGGGEAAEAGEETEEAGDEETEDSQGSESGSAEAASSPQEESTSSSGGGPDDDDDEAGSPETTDAEATSAEGNDDSPADEGAVGDCTFEVDSSISERISTVGIVEWSVDGSVESASIEFGRDTSYGLSAPVDLDEENYRTLLLGMKAESVYHFQIVATVDGEECRSADFTVETGLLPNALTRPMIETNAPEELAGGYKLLGFWGNSGGGPAFILDADNDFVWYFPVDDDQDVMRARLTFNNDGIWLRNTAQIDGTGVVRRVSLDGLSEEVFELPTTTHDLTITPEGTIGLINHTMGGNGCDEIVEYDPETDTLTQIYNLEEAHGQSDCHANAINYYAVDDTFLVSDWAQSSFVKVTREGELVWVLNGEASSFTGSDWTYQHNAHVLAPDHLVVFSNGGNGSNSIVYEFMLDLDAMTAEEIWRYDGGLRTMFGGDVQRLENGNTLITYSSSGVMREINSDGDVLQELSWSVGSTIGYTEQRPSLYTGEPPKIY